ncbi:hypothetical protein ACTWP5_20885 [Streptomyces sp. 4N509B]|uniref:hypothetical protein n=1 Tax=Streptomyces sp. 4N509B TaxID=3457413 RepID=UPI003FD36EBF
MDLIPINITGVREAEAGAADRDGLASLKEKLSQISSDAAMFGGVPNAARAAQALSAATLAMFSAVEGAGRTVQDIERSARTAAGIGEQTDAEAQGALMAVQAEPDRSRKAAMALTDLLSDRSGGA